MKKLFRSYAFWVALAGAVVIFLEDISALIGLDINVSVIESLIMSICGVLVVLGIVKKKDTPETNEESSNETLEDVSESVENSLQEMCRDMEEIVPNNQDEEK